MKKVSCTEYKFDCCDTCHNDDQFFKMNFKGFEINSCCSSLYEIEDDIRKHLEEPLENDCQ